MKTYYKILIIVLVGVMSYACGDITDINENPNEPADVTTSTLMTGSQKKMVDYIYDNWFSGRQALPYAQYWSQRTYTEEDRYQIRESVNNNYFNQLYMIVANLDLIVAKCENEPAVAVLEGNVDNQKAAAKIMKVWLMQVIADTWGSVPYSEVGMLKVGKIYPKYDNLNEIYPALIDELDVAISLIDETEPAFNSGDIIYGGDASLWKKFAGSLKTRLAIRLSKVDSNWKTYIAEAIASGIFESNEDQAMFKYTVNAPNESNFYRGFFVDGRNDFSITKPFVDLLKGQKDTLNAKSHPFEGKVDPRLKIYTTARGGKYLGLPYGLASSSMNRAIRDASPTWYSYPPITLNKDFSVPFMTYAELCFILSEYNNFDQAWYEKGIRASIDHWYALANISIKDDVKTTVEAYVTAVAGVANAETVATQKYIHLYMQGTEAWSEYRRTGYPKTMLKPGEKSYNKAGTILTFTTLSETKNDLPARVKYPTNESTLNPDAFKAAVAKLTDGTNNYYSKMYWDVRTSSNPNPGNK